MRSQPRDRARRRSLPTKASQASRRDVPSGLGTPLRASSFVPARYFCTRVNHRLGRDLGLSLSVIWSRAMKLSRLARQRLTWACEAARPSSMNALLRLGSAAVSIGCALLFADAHDARAGWTTPLAVSQASVVGSEPQVAVDGAGNTSVAWVSGTSPNRNIRSAYRPAGGPWGASVSPLRESWIATIHSWRSTRREPPLSLRIAMPEPPG
jgi:hypothetical protein